MRSDAFVSAGAVLSAAVSSACCWLPLVLLGTGLSAAGVGVIFEHFRIPFLLIAGLLLSLGFYLNYRPEAADDRDGCCTPKKKKSGKSLNRLMLWVSTALVALFALFPGYVSALFAGATPSVNITQADTLVVGIEGMTCTGCEAAVETALATVPGVLSVKASYPDAHAVVVSNKQATPSQPALARALNGIGYRLASWKGQEGREANLAGEWVADAALEDSTTISLVVDLGFVGTRFAGEFDVQDWGVVDYPVEVGLSDSTVRLHFAGPNADFVGQLSGDSLLTGEVSFEETTLPLTLRRAGGPQFSATFLALEKTADDSSLVERLSPNDEELRKQFNSDADRTRLVMLLSPT